MIHTSSHVPVSDHEVTWKCQFFLDLGDAADWARLCVQKGPGPDSANLGLANP